MAYRDVSESLRAYRDRIAADLEEARRAADEAAKRAERVGALERELAETEGLLSKLGQGPRKLPVLENVAIAAPCSASWDQMVGDDRVRFCGQCEKNVYNLSALPREEAEALLAARESKMCVRLYRRADGTVLTSDCPVGVRRRRRRRVVAGVVGGGLMAVTATTMLASVSMGEPARPVTMGAVAVVTGETFVQTPAGPGTTDTTTTTESTSITGPAPTVPVMGRLRRATPHAAPPRGEILGTPSVR